MFILLNKKADSYFTNKRNIIYLTSTIIFLVVVMLFYF